MTTQLIDWPINLKPNATTNWYRLCNGTKQKEKPLKNESRKSEENLKRSILFQLNEPVHYAVVWLYICRYPHLFYVRIYRRGEYECNKKNICVFTEKCFLKNVIKRME